MRRLPLASLACALVLAPVGCDGDSGGEPKPPKAESAPRATTSPSTETAPTTEPAALSAPEYRRQVNALCVEDKKLAKRLPSPSTAAEIPRYLRRTLDLNKRREPKYRALEPPAALLRDHEAALELGDELERQLEDTLARIEDGGDPAQEFTKALPALARGVEKGNAISRRLGTRKCIVEVPDPAAQPDQGVS